MTSPDNKHQLLQQYVCLAPFIDMSIRDDASYVCCWSTLPIPLSLSSHDKNKLLEKIRISVTDGSYSHCDPSCVSLNKLVHTGQPSDAFVSMEQFKETYKAGPTGDFPMETVYLNFDKSCNLHCRSCRTEVILNPKDIAIIEEKKQILNWVDQRFAKDVKTIYMSGSGDPLFSNLYREFLINFDKTKYPKLQGIFLQHNGMLLNEALWLKLKAREYLTDMDISLDAATKDTYENLVRQGGKWDTVLANIKFLASRPVVKAMRLSMVVSSLNFREMEAFCTLIDKLNETSSVTITPLFRQIINWGTYTDSEINELSVFVPGHRYFDEFLTCLNKVRTRTDLIHNFHHL